MADFAHKLKLCASPSMQEEAGSCVQIHQKPRSRRCYRTVKGDTLVMPKTPMLGLEEVEPLPVPSNPAMMQQIPSVKMPLRGKKKKKKGPQGCVRCSWSLS